MAKTPGLTKEDFEKASSNKEILEIINDKNINIKKNLSCQPCMKRKCPLKHNNCMKLIKADEIFGIYHSKVPFVKQLIHHTMDRAQQRGWIRTILGRKCRFNMWEPASFGMHKPQTFEDASMEHGSRNIKRAFTYKALNKLIQGSAADMTKQAMVDIHRLGITPLIQIHDEVAVSVSNDDQIDSIVHAMENAVKLGVPSKVDVEIGPNWGEIK
mgnify:CR=1 FL=1